jgi:hypothetical protein
MSTSALNLDDLMLMVRACEAIELDDSIPPYLAEFIARILEENHPELAARVRRFDAERAALVGKFIKLAQTLTRSPGG